MEDEWEAVLRGNPYNSNGVNIIPANPNPLTRTVTDVVITVTFPNTTPAPKRPERFVVNFNYGGTPQPERRITNP